MDQLEHLPKIKNKNNEIFIFSGEKRLNDPVDLDKFKEPAAKKKKVKNNKMNRKSSAF